MNESVPDLKVLLADRGYDADAVRADIEEGGTVAIIPTIRNRRVQIEIDGAIYALRNRSNAASIASKTPVVSQPAIANLPRPSMPSFT